MTGLQSNSITRVVILGGGHSGVRAAKRLLELRQPRDKLEVIIVSHENVEVWHGLMPQIVAGLVQPQYALVPLRQILPGATIYTYEVEQIDLPNRRVILNSGDERDQTMLDYDYLVVALGSSTDLSRFPGLAEHGLQTKTIGDVVHLRNHVIDMLDRAAVEQDTAERRRMLTFTVAGAGFAGVEIGTLANQMIRGALRFYPTIKESEIRFIVLSRSERILPALSDRLVRRALRQMERSGIEVMRGVGLASATAATAVLTNGERIATRTLIVTTGIGSNPVVARLPVTLRSGRIVCDRFCRVEGWSGVYATGDDAAIPTPGGGVYPPTGFVAIAQGKRAAENILAELRGRPLTPFRYEGMEAALLSKGYAVTQFRRFQLDGWLAAIIWRLALLTYIQTWQRRIALLQDWLTGSIFPPDITRMGISRSDAIVPMRFAAGDLIIREGDPGSRFYTIIDGTVEIVRRTADGGEEHLESLGRGQYFGEIALLHEVKRTATARAATDTTVLSIARQDFNALVQHLPLLRYALDRRRGPTAP
ncbi:MAG TPA: FAD-dependent oxidoreductase [Chloroflexota bacterium]|nr:FAD-dependent oxidoreductase [Chloroflexota bacterium]